MNRINTVGKLFCFGKAVFIADKVVALGFLCGIIAAGGFQIYGKLRAGLRGFKLGFAVISVLDKGNIAFLDGFIDRIGNCIVLCGVVFRFRADVVVGTVQLIALGRCDLTQAPIVAADKCFPKFSLTDFTMSLRKLVSFAIVRSTPPIFSLGLICRLILCTVPTSSVMSSAAR